MTTSRNGDEHVCVKTACCYCGDTKWVMRAVNPEFPDMVLCVGRSDCASRVLRQIMGAVEERHYRPAAVSLLEKDGDQ